jgi:GT2 family glycosyltransferase
MEVATDSRASNPDPSTASVDSLPPEREAAVARRTRSAEHGVADRSTSVVVVTYRISRSTFEATMSALDGQTVDDFELVVVDNGTDWAVTDALEPRSVPWRYLELESNLGVTVARNVGATVADGELLVFLDDDGVPRADFVEQHRLVHERPIVAARGRVVPPDDSIYNRMQSHYDLGDETVPYPLNIEGNTSIDRDVFLSVGGFTEELAGRAGHEGIELSYRLRQQGFDRDEIVYYPNAVLYHDYATGLFDYLAKQFERRRHEQYLQRHSPAIFEFGSDYESPVDGPEYDGIDRVKVLSIAGVVKVLSGLDRRLDLR